MSPPAAVKPEDPSPTRVPETYWTRIKNAVAGTPAGPQLPDLSRSSANSNGHPNSNTDDSSHVRDTASRSHTLPRPNPLSSPEKRPIAIIGMSCRMPGSVSSPAEFWELLTRCRSGFGPIPHSRFNPSAFHHPVAGRAGCFTPTGGHFLQCDVRAFDAPFFGFTRKEATSLDPQQRLLLECTFEALENAGIPKHTIVGRDVGVFVAGSFSEYESHLFRDSDSIPMHQATGCAYAMQSNRISHFFDLRGPSFTSDTACSSSMVAVHLACQSLRAGESSVALVGGCHLNMLPEFWVSFSTSRLLSESGRSMAFDGRGTGFGRGEGCAMMVLKPLDLAIRDKDIIRAVIAGTGINQDGKTPGITMPNGDAQEALIAQVYKRFNLNPRDCGFVEAHGTGTRAGDPIEATAIYNTLGKGRTRSDPLFLGSVKSNVGHLEGASGMAGLLKAVLMTERGFMLPNFDFKHPNPKIPWDEWNLRVPKMQAPFPQNKRYISVNNFGFGGTNGHVVIEAAPYLAKDEPVGPLEKQHRIFVFTANDQRSLERVMQGVVLYLERRPEVFEGALMRNLAYTLGQRRSLLQWRAAIHAKQSLELVAGLNGSMAISRRELEAVTVGFVFNGQGAQWWAMGRELYEQFPTFTASIQKAGDCLAGMGAEWSLVDELAKDEISTSIGEAHISQPACTAIQLALVDLLRDWGVYPAAVVGHSSGEIAAAYSSGIISFESAVTIAFHRGRLIPILKKQFPELKGRMMAVGGTKEEVQSIIDSLANSRVGISCYNSPASLTVSGDEAALSELETFLEARGMFNRRLLVDVAYHSGHMELVAKEYRDALVNLPNPRSTPTIKFYSSLHGHQIDGSKLRADYWVDNLTHPVRFSEAVEEMLGPSPNDESAVNTLIELGPHSALQGPVKQILKSVVSTATYDSALIRNKDAVETMMDLGLSLFTKGVNLNFQAINFPKLDKEPRLLNDLPNYPWNHQQRYWHESWITTKYRQRSQPRSDLLGVETVYSTDLEPTWRNVLRMDDVPWLRQHKINGIVMYPLSGFLVMALEAADQRARASGVQVDGFELRDVLITTPLIITDEDVDIITSLRPRKDTNGSSRFEGWIPFRISSYSSENSWIEHCAGFVSTWIKPRHQVDVNQKFGTAADMLKSFRNSTRDSAATPINVSNMYAAMAESGIVFGTAFQGISSCEAGSSHSSGTISIRDVAKEMPNNVLSSPLVHPCVLESLASMYWTILAAGGDPEVKTAAYLPSAVARLSISVEAISFCKQPGRALTSYCEAKFTNSAPRPTKVTVFASDGKEPTKSFLSIENLLVSPMVSKADGEIAKEPRELCYKMDWEPIICKNQDTKETIANRDGEKGPRQLPPVAVVHDGSLFQTHIASVLKGRLDRLSANANEMATLEALKPAGKTILSLCEMNTPLLSQLTEEKFRLIHQALNQAEGCLWVVRGAYLASTNPDSNMISGLSRSIRSETEMRFATLDLDGVEIMSDEQTVAMILEVFTIVFGPHVSSTTSELEFVERSGSLQTPRIIKDDDLNAYLHHETSSLVLEDASFTDPSRPLKLARRGRGVLEPLHFVDDLCFDHPLAADEVEIEIKAIGICHQDLAVLKNPAFDGDFGYEISGVVISIGAGCTSVKVADRVCALVHGGYASRLRTKEHAVFRILDKMTFEAAAGLPLAYSTAYYSLFEIARLEPGDIILIHDAAGPVGQAAVRLAQITRAKRFVTVRDVQEKESLMREHGLLDEEVFYSHSAKLGAAIRHATGGSGVNFVLCAGTGDVLTELLECLGEFGKFVCTGRDGGGHPAKLLDLNSDNRNISFATVDFLTVVKRKPEVTARVLREISSLLNADRIRQVGSVTAFGISELQDAFKAIQNGRLSMKTVIVPQPGEMVKAIRSKQKDLFRNNATYLLVGGTGGLGRSISRWMLSRGARHIVLVSRTGARSSQVDEVIYRAEEMGAKVVVRKCDVANRREVDCLVTHGVKNMPEICGVIHGTMVLRDVLFEKMTWQDYDAVVQGKVQGAWNLHHALTDRKLDFFVALSSAAGVVGNRGQAAYAAANCFLTAFVQHRLSQGLAASALDLTMVVDAGHLAENTAKMDEVVRTLGGDVIYEREVLALLGAAVSGRLALSCNNHVITGVRISRTPSPFWAGDAKFKHLSLADGQGLAQPAGAVSAGAAFKIAQSADEEEAAIRDGLTKKIAAVLMLEPGDLDVARPLTHYHLDSLVAIEVRNYIAREFEANLQVMELLASGSIASLAKLVHVRSKLVQT